MSAAGVPAGLSDELIALRAKYLEERTKRVRLDGNDQYREMVGELSHFVDDPWTQAAGDRRSVRTEHQVIVVGGGLGGLVVAAALNQVGITDIQIVEKGGDFGGTWYWNRYPGAMCDTESLIDLPLLEETGYMPTQRYVDGAEIRQHLQSIAHMLGLHQHALSQTGVTGAAWDEARGRWTVSTDRDDELSAQFLVIANGPLSKPKLPAIAGIETFQGHTFHTSRWDFDYTGGDVHGGLDRLRDQRVAVIGTGATGVQCIPHLAAAAQQLYVFQRTPAAVDVRNNGPIDGDVVQSAEPGWQRARMRNYSSIIAGNDEPVDLVGDGWTEMFRDVSNAAIEHSERHGGHLTADERAALFDHADLRTMERIRARVEALVGQPAVAAAMLPWYGRWCKRPCFHDEYLPVFNQPNVTLVDTEGRGVDRITETAVVVGDRWFEVDCLIFATGFEVGTAYTRRIGYDLIGRDGLHLSRKWADGLQTFHGLQTNGFPNLFFLGANQTGVTPNYTYMATEQARHIAHVVAQVGAGGSTIVEASLEAEREWVDEIRRLEPERSPYAETCTPSFLNGEGRPADATGLLAGTYGAGPIAFADLLEAWRTDGSMQGLLLR